MLKFKLPIKNLTTQYLSLTLAKITNKLIIMYIPRIHKSFDHYSINNQNLRRIRSLYILIKACFQLNRRRNLGDHILNAM